jgi:hypothetical protein
MTSGPDDERRQPSEPTFADVMNGFSFDSGRSTRRRKWGRRRGEDVELAEEAGAATGADQQAASPGRTSPGSAGYGPTGYASADYSSTGHASTGYASADYSSMGHASTGYGSAGYGSAGYGSAGYGSTGSAPPGLVPPNPATAPIDMRVIDAGDFGQGGGAAAVRPYAWTRGRTKSGLDLAIETLVSTSQRGRDQMGLLQSEHRAVAELCEQTRSVAEVAALLSLPLGVARVLLGDMAGLGVVTVHQTASSAGNVPDLALMERVLSGLRRL